MRNFPMAFSSLRLSAIVLVAANLLPLAGVLFLGWSLFEIVFLYWFENAIVFFYTILKLAWMDFFHGGVKGDSVFKTAVLFPLKVLAVFFPFGIFMFIHLVFAYLIGTAKFGSPPPHTLYLVFLGLAKILPSLWIPALALFMSHGVSFLRNFVGRQEYLRYEGVTKIATAPYQRVIPMHFAVFVGLFFMALLGNPIWFLAAPVLLKLFVDLWSHIREHALEEASRATHSNPPLP